MVRYVSLSRVPFAMRFDVLCSLHCFRFSEIIVVFLVRMRRSTTWTTNTIPSQGTWTSKEERKQERIIKRMNANKQRQYNQLAHELRELQTNLEETTKQLDIMSKQCNENLVGQLGKVHGSWLIGSYIYYMEQMLGKAQWGVDVKKYAVGLVYVGLMKRSMVCEAYSLHTKTINLRRVQVTKETFSIDGAFRKSIGLVSYV